MEPLYLPALTSNQVSAEAITLESRHHNLYFVRFENGYSNIFFTDVESGHWVEEDLGFTKLAAEIGERLSAMGTLSTFRIRQCSWYSAGENGENSPAFGYHRYSREGQLCYDIFHSNRRYAYTLVEWDDHEWQVTGKGNNLMKHAEALRALEISRILTNTARV